MKKNRRLFKKFKNIHKTKMNLWNEKYDSRKEKKNWTVDSSGQEKKKKEENEKKYSKVIKEFLSEQKNMSFQIERINRGPSRLGEHQPTQLWHFATVT